MRSNELQQKHSKVLGFLSTLMPAAIFLLILNWLFNITPLQKLQGMPLLMSLPSLLGFILAGISLKRSLGRTGKLGMVMNSILFILPFLYWTLGTVFFGA
ncbi:MAG TPA: hypothetical protein VIO64_05885 [Pseudobacteroides sp.]|uniref:hypothetical protein n=1 Tax=Pseudobacteroides sp. TaxID=1968840 RepID=UPI002F947154